MSLFNSHDPEIVRILKEIAEAEAGQIELLADIRKLAAGIFVVTEEIRDILGSQKPRQTGFSIEQLRTIQVSHDKGKTWCDYPSINQIHTAGVTIMPIVGIVVGATGVFTETPTPAGSTIPAGTVPQWTTSDTVNTTLTPSADGTSVSVATATTAPVGGSFTLTVANQDGTFPTGVSVPFLAPAPPPQSGFEINQTS